MNQSTWTILVLGVLAFFFVMLGMLLVFSDFQASPEGSYARIANDVKSTFELESAAADYAENEGLRILHIEYVTERDSNFDAVRQEAEMRSIAIFAFKALDAAMKKKIDEVRISRSEVHGSGFWQDVYKTSYAMTGEDLRKMEPEPEKPEPKKP